MNKPIALTVLLASASVISGCASLGYGESETHCNENPDAPNCQGPIENYEDTETTDRIPSSREEQKEMEEEKVRELAEQMNGGAPVQPPTMDRTRPIRKPAEVLRIWVAPWVGQEDQLNMPGYVYAEIQKRRWLIGEERPESATQGSIHPLQVEEPASQKYGGPNEGGTRTGTAGGARLPGGAGGTGNQQTPQFGNREVTEEDMADMRQQIRERARQQTARPQ